jgi:hypothetical protein
MKFYQVFLIIFYLIFFVFVGCNRKESTVDYEKKQGYVNDIKVDFDCFRNKNVTTKLYVLTGNKNFRKVEIKNTSFIGQVGDPVIVMMNPKDSQDIWIMSKGFTDKKALKLFLEEHSLKLSPFFEKQINK